MTFQPRWIIGKRVVAVHMRPWGKEDGKKVYDPCIEFEDGSRFWGNPQTNDDSDNYVEAAYSPPPKKRKPR